VRKYRAWYDHLMARAFGRELDGYSERHHIIPRSLGGNDDPPNIVRLTYREHFLAHWLLTKFTMGRDRIKMLHALHRMGNAESDDKNLIVAGWQYAVARKAQRDAILGMKRSAETRAKMSQAQVGNTKALGKSVSEKSREATAKRNRERVFTPEIRANLRMAQLGRKDSPETVAIKSKVQMGRLHPEETKVRMSASAVKLWAGRRARRHANLICAVLSFGA